MDDLGSILVLQIALRVTDAPKPQPIQQQDIRQVREAAYLGQPQINIRVSLKENFIAIPVDLSDCLSAEHRDGLANGVTIACQRLSIDGFMVQCHAPDINRHQVRTDYLHRRAQANALGMAFHMIYLPPQSLW
jgi:hypothetical protein